ncbi:MAG: hypothetical protein QOJ80_6884 [Mycobacterium sp.]|nr:hypothetical protein [Mycobacterium sp.]
MVVGEVVVGEVVVDEDGAAEPPVLCAPAPAEELDDVEVPDAAEPSEDDEPDSSASATPTTGPTADKPNNAALTPADAAPNCNQRRTPKFSARRTRAAIY